ncbi:hypothetical protein O3G_MSEX005560 [Manduca sexta]|uniref:Uncharacterized protein n=1 Tax=Manduca sexta TaxID=7130 RepID=A0A922CK93_MANSE|nr:hypothetical protein O3G_MSEX005560 [Manduca sexta]KAG6448623.1 hypothetical protein O3G_MSEX005560 [Manduca sexta]
MVYDINLSYTILLVFITITALPASCIIEEIKKLTINNNGYGKYSFEYETSGGTYRREEGGVAPSSGDSLAVRGEYGYVDSAGRLYSLKYVADDNGFRPESSDYSVRYNDRRLI